MSRPASPPSPAAEQHWATNATAAEVAARLRTAQRVVVVTHSKPDGDAAGSVLAMVRALGRAGVAAQAWLVGPQPRWLAAIAGSTPVTLIPPGQAPSESGPDADAVLILDTGSWSQLRELAGWIRARHD